MNRRSFLLSTAGAIGAATVAPRLLGATAPERDPIVLTLIRANDDLVRRYLPRQERRTGHRWLGGIPDEYGIFTARAAGHFIVTLVCAVYSRESAYYQADSLLEPLRLASRCLLAAQHEDGTTDLPATNFHSTPDTAFTLESVGPAIVIIQNGKWAPGEALLADLKVFALKAGDAFATGGIHTPNHRWVVCAALARLQVLFPNSKYVARIDQWLAETVDIDPDGQFTEKSTSVYSPVVDQALLTVARLLDRPELIEAVRRNLEMTLFYVHPDGEVVTEASKRQDKYQRGSMSRYYYSYRWLALRERSSRFAAMARQIERTAAAQLAGDLPAFLEDPTLQRPMPESAPLPTDYVKHFSFSALARIRRQDISATILAENSTLFSLRKGTAALEAVRFASAFFGKGQFVGEKLEVRDGRYVMRQTLDGPYFQPLTKAQLDADGGHVKLTPNGTLAASTRALRARSNVQALESVATITETAGKFEIAISITGTDQVPVAIELAFRHDGELRGVEPVAGLKDAFLLRRGRGQYVQGGQVIEFGPGHGEHTWTQLRGALPKWDGQSVYLTGFTPFKATIQIS
ncbi:MAG: hypothetical protein EXS38_11175 [Opitutus sp.]|nr:hypothetical protein [Opitutus sp.]